MDLGIIPGPVEHQILCLGFGVCETRCFYLPEKEIAAENHIIGYIRFSDEVFSRAVIDERCLPARIVTVDRIDFAVCVIDRSSGGFRVLAELDEIERRIIFIMFETPSQTAMGSP